MATWPASLKAVGQSALFPVTPHLHPFCLGPITHLCSLGSQGSQDPSISPAREEESC